MKKLKNIKKPQKYLLSISLVGLSSLALFVCINIFILEVLPTTRL